MGKKTPAQSIYSKAQCEPIGSACMDYLSMLDNFAPDFPRDQGCDEGEKISAHDG
jgi:hypothetical protein